MARAYVGPGGTAPGDLATIRDIRVPRSGSTASGSPISVDTDAYDQFDITALATNPTINATGTPAHGQRLVITVFGAASHTLTWGTAFLGSGVAPLVTTTAAGKRHTFGFRWDSRAASNAGRWVQLASDAAGYTP